MRAIGHDIKITGIKNFKLDHLRYASEYRTECGRSNAPTIIRFSPRRVNVDKLEIDVGVSFPYLRYEGTYDVNAKFVNIPVKGKGPMRGNASE